MYAHGQRIRVIYRRVDEATMLCAGGAGGQPLGAALSAALSRGQVTVLNTLVKVPTYPCADPHHLGARFWTASGSWS